MKQLIQKILMSNTLKEKLIYFTVFIFSLAILLLIYLYEAKSLSEKLQTNTQQHALLIEKEIDTNIQNLSALRSVFSIFPEISRQEFKNLTLPVLSKYNSIQALEWIPEVSMEQRVAYESKARKTFHDFQFKEKIDNKLLPSQTKNIYYPVYYLEPYSGNEKALGYDLSSSNTRLQTLMQSKNNKQILATSKITLVQSNQAGFLVFFPVFSSPQKNFTGFILGVFNIEGIIQHALKDYSLHNFSLYDQNKELLLSKGTVNTDNTYHEKIKTADRVWNLQVFYSPALIQNFPITILAFISIIFLNFVFIYAYIQKKREYAYLQNFNSELQIKVDQSVCALHDKDLLMLEQSRLAQMGELLSMISHQWKQPLAVISVVSINMRMYLGDAREFLPEEFYMNMAKDLEKIKFQVLNLSNIIDDFKNFYRSDNEFTTSSYKQAIEKSLAIVKGSLMQDSIELEYNYVNDVDLQMLENELMHVILNLISNAQDNFRKNKIEKPSITFHIEDNVLNITDNGTGIDQDIADKIFNPYFSTKKEKNGVGLGLYMSKIIIEKHHNGKLVVTNNQNSQGSCFSITINTDLP